MSISPEQSRAARGWLGWTQAELAARAKVGVSTIKDFEGGSRTPIPNNLTAIRGALEAAGIAFVFKGDTPTGIAAREGAGQSATPSRAEVSGKRRGSGVGGRRG